MLEKDAAGRAFPFLSITRPLVRMRSLKSTGPRWSYCSLGMSPGLPAGLLPSGTYLVLAGAWKATALSRRCIVKPWLWCQGSCLS